MEFFGPEFWNSLLSPTAQASLTEKLIIVAVVWATMGRKVSKRFKEMREEAERASNAAIATLKSHLGIIEGTLGEAVKEIRGVKEAFKKDLDIHALRMDKIETGLSTVQDGLTQAIGTLTQLNKRLEQVELNQKGDSNESAT